MSERNTGYQFVSTDTEAVESLLISIYEKITGVSVKPASPEKLFIQFVAAVVIQERGLNNYTGNQNIPSRAEGENLDALAELFYVTQRPAAQAAVCTERFHISEAQTTAILIPAGTRVTDASGTLTWETVADAYVSIGETYADVQIRCQTVGAVGNGYAVGQINTFVDLFDYCERCENLTASDDGADQATDDEFYELMRASQDAYSCAGAKGGYIYFAKQVSTKIADVVANSPSDGAVDLYVLMDDGTIAKIDRITPHCVVGQCSVERLGDIFLPASREASCNYGIGADGRVGMYVEEKNRSWCSSSNANDQRAVTIECASDGAEPYAFRDVVYQSLITLCVDICKRNGKTKLLWLEDKDKTLAYTPAPDEMVLTVHRWFANKSCPGNWMYARMGDLAENVTAQLSAGMDEEDDDMDINKFKELWREMRKELQDNDASAYSEEARKWAVDNGIIRGGNSDEFNGMWEDMMTREQLVTVLYRFAQKFGLS